MLKRMAEEPHRILLQRIFPYNYCGGGGSGGWVAEAQRSMDNKAATEINRKIVIGEKKLDGH